MNQINSQPYYFIAFSNTADDHHQSNCDFVVLSAKPKSAHPRYLRRLYLPAEQGGFENRPIPLLADDQYHLETEYIVPWTTDASTSLEMTVTITAQRKFWVVIEYDRTLSHQRYQLLEARGPFPTRDAAIEASILQG